MYLHFLLALLMGLGLGMESVNGGSGTNTPTGPATVAGELGHVLTSPELAEAVQRELRDYTVEEMQASLGGGPVSTSLEDFSPQTSHVTGLEHDWNSIFAEFATPATPDFNWQTWLTRMCQGKLNDATFKTLHTELSKMAVQYPLELLKQTSLNLLLSGAFGQEKITWPSDLNVLQDFTPHYNYGSLHTFDVTLGPNLWTDTDIPKVIGDRLIVLQPDLKTYSAPIRLLEALIGTVADHWRLPAHELHLWRRLAGCEPASTKLKELLSKVPLYKTLFTSQIPTDETTTLRIHSSLQSLTQTWFYYACPMAVLMRTFNSGLNHVLRHGLDKSTDDFEDATAEFCTAHDTSADWVPSGENLNFHYTARGALLMAMYIYSKLSRSKRMYFDDEPLVLMRFKLPLKWLIKGFTEKTLRLWNRLYFEHSLASTAPLHFDICSLATMQLFSFRHFDHCRLRNGWGSTWTTRQVGIYFDMYWRTIGEKHFYRCGHLTLPLPLKELLEKDSKTRKRTADEDYDGTD